MSVAFPSRLRVDRWYFDSQSWLIVPLWLEAADLAAGSDYRLDVPMVQRLYTAWQLLDLEQYPDRESPPPTWDLVVTAAIAAARHQQPPPFTPEGYIEDKGLQVSFYNAIGVDARLALDVFSGHVDAVVRGGLLPAPGDAHVSASQGVGGIVAVCTSAAAGTPAACTFAAAGAAATYASAAAGAPAACASAATGAPAPAAVASTRLVHLVGTGTSAADTQPGISSAHGAGVHAQDPKRRRVVATDGACLLCKKMTSNATRAALRGRLCTACADPCNCVLSPLAAAACSSCLQAVRALESKWGLF